MTKRWLQTPFQVAHAQVWAATHNLEVTGEFWFRREIYRHYLSATMCAKTIDYNALPEYLNHCATPDIPG